MVWSQAEIVLGVLGFLMNHERKDLDVKANFYQDQPFKSHVTLKQARQTQTDVRAAH